MSYDLYMFEPVAGEDPQLGRFSDPAKDADVFRKQFESGRPRKSTWKLGR